MTPSCRLLDGNQPQTELFTFKITIDDFVISVNDLEGVVAANEIVVLTYKFLKELYGSKVQLVSPKTI